MKIKLLTVIISSLLVGCSHIDDYMLGKDNTPQPKALKDIDSTIKISQNWVTPAGKSHKSNDYLKLKPVVDGASIYTADASGLVQSVNKSRGKINWSTQLKHGLVSGPTVSSGYIAVGTNASTVALLSKFDGKVLWESKVSAEVLSPPAISHNKVLAKTIDGKVYAFNIQTGQSLWTVEHGSPSLILKASSSPIIVGNLALIGFPDGKLDALDLNDGRLVWQQSIAYATGASDVERLIDIDADPIVRNQVAYLASYQGYIGALSLIDGHFIWRKPASVYKNMTLSASTLYFTDSNDVVWALDANTGKVNWKQKSLKARGLTEPTLMGSEIAVADKIGYLHILAAKDGQLISRYQLSAGVTMSPTSNGKALYVLTDNGQLNRLSVS